MKYDVIVTNEYAFVIDKNYKKSNLHVDNNGDIKNYEERKILAHVPLDAEKYPIYRTAAILPNLHTIDEFINNKHPKKFNKKGEFVLSGLLFWEGNWVF